MRPDRVDVQRTIVIGVLHEGEQEFGSVLVDERSTGRVARRHGRLRPAGGDCGGQHSADPGGEARIWFYRDYEPYAGKGLPAIAANGGYVGAAELGGAFYRDVPPGQYVVTVQTVGIDTNQTANFELAPAQEAYVKIVSLPSWDTGGDKNQWERPTFYAWLIPNQVAQADVARLSFYGGS